MNNQKTKKSKRNYWVIALVIFLLAVSLGYSAFSSNLKIGGTATASGDWDIHFENPTISSGDENNIVTLSSDNKTLTVAVKLTEPGDSKTVTVDIVNKGAIDATLKNFTITAVDGNKTTIDGEGGVYTSGAIKMTLDELTTNEILVKETGTKTYTMKFEWPADYDASEVINDVATFTITFEYEQAI